MNVIKYVIFLIFTFMTLIQEQHAQTIPFSRKPDWQSKPSGHFSTGLGLADINGDGWKDIIVANGNDIVPQNLVIYYNNGAGAFPKTPDWSSQDIDYHGHLSVGDIDGDGWNDVAVSVFLGPAGFNEYGHVKVYYNQNGSLESLPSFKSSDHYFTFSCALGDADGDGDLDLAVAGGQTYENGIGVQLTFGRIYYNDNGALQSLPGWTSQDTMAALDVDFADVDQNGFLDLIFANHLTPNYLYLADSTGCIGTRASWYSEDTSYFANSLDLGRVNADVYPDLVISDNRQMGGVGNFKLYQFNATRPAFSIPDWRSRDGGYGSGLLLADVNLDGHLDLLAGRWWSPLMVYPGNGTTFVTAPTFVSSTNSVIEAIEIADLDQDFILEKIDTVLVEKKQVAVVYLSMQNPEEILEIKQNGTVIAPSEYRWIPGKNWITFSRRLLQGTRLQIKFSYSNDGDVVLSNWDENIGNYIFYNRTAPTKVVENQTIGTPGAFSLSGPYPNPFNHQTAFRCYIPVLANAHLKVFTITGQLVDDYLINFGQTGDQIFQYQFPQLSATGVYFYKITIDRHQFIGRMVYLK